MTEHFLNSLDISNLLNVIAGVVAFFIAYLKILPLVPRSSAKILSDLDVLDRATSAGISNVDEIKQAIESEIRRKYRKPTRIHSYPEFFFSLLLLILISYFVYSKAADKSFDNLFYFLVMIDFLALAFLTDAFNDPAKGKNDEHKRKMFREPVFKFEIYSWWELFSGIAVTCIFGFWTYYRLFKDGKLAFDWWAILTLVLMFSGIAMLTGAFNKNEDQKKKKTELKNDSNES